MNPPTEHLRHGLFAITLAAVLAGCAGAPRPMVLTPDGPMAMPTWTAEELGKEIAIRPIRRDERASHQMVRISGAEKPHAHDRHDLFVVVLSGRARMHLGDRVVEMEPGDTAVVPRGVAHWAENLHPVASEAYTIFTPPYDGKDNRPIDVGGGGR